MGDTALVYRQKLVSAISEANKHIGRIDILKVDTWNMPHRRDK